jgi:hypothetical protein
MNKNEPEKDLRIAARSYYACLRGKTVQITKLEQLVTRYAVAILALVTLLLVLNR